MRLLKADKSMIGIVSLKEALKMAAEEVSPCPAVN